MSLNLASVVFNSARHHPDELALIHDEERLTYKQRAARVCACAAHLRDLGVERGDKVALLMPNRLSFTVAYFGILAAGGAVGRGLT